MRYQWSFPTTSVKHTLVAKDKPTYGFDSYVRRKRLPNYKWMQYNNLIGSSEQRPINMPKQIDP